MATKRKQKGSTIIHEGKKYQWIVPAKRLFNSDMIYETITRGDIFALCEDGTFTILPGSVLHATPAATDVTEGASE